MFDLSCSQDSKNDGLWRRILLRDVSPIEVLLTARLLGCRLSCVLYNLLSTVLYNLLPGVLYDLLYTVLYDLLSTVRPSLQCCVWPGTSISKLVSLIGPL